jgi:hypothetical protein
VRRRECMILIAALVTGAVNAAPQGLKAAAQ